LGRFWLLVLWEQSGIICGLAMGMMEHTCQKC